MDSLKVKIIFTQQKEDGFWVQEDRFYKQKYQGTVWQLLFLAELGVHDKRMEEAILILKKNQMDFERWEMENTINGKIRYVSILTLKLSKLVCRASLPAKELYIGLYHYEIF